MTSIPYKNDEYEQMPYDLVKELTIGTLVIGVVVVLLAVVFSTPDLPSLTAKQVNKQAPMVLVKTALDDLSQQDPISTYGPPYNRTKDNIQKIGSFAPQTWSGVSIPIHSAKVEVIDPLQRISNIDSKLVNPLHTWNQASTKQQQDWVTAVQKVLKKSSVSHETLILPQSNQAAYGPVPKLINGYLLLAKSGLMEAAIDGQGPMPATNRTKSLLLLQDRADGQYADKLDMTGDQWGIIKETGNYPGAVWLWYYTLLYQIPPFNTAAAADLWVVIAIVVVTGLLMFIPFIPGLRSIPKGLKVYRIIWRDYYREQQKQKELNT